MNDKKLGMVLLILSILILVMVFSYISKLTISSRKIGCLQDEECGPLESALSLSHLAFGVIGFIFALGFYLLLFTRGEEAILKTLKENKNKELGKERFNLVLKGLDSFEKKVMTAVKNQDGITQSTLRIRIDMSKAKLSYVLKDLENKGLIKRIKKGKTLSVFLRDNF